MSAKKSFIMFLLTFGFLAGAFKPAMADVPAPSLALREAITIAEDALTKAKIDFSKHYVYSVIYTNSSQGQYWLFTYKSNVSTDIMVKVYMNGKTEFSGRYFLKREGY